MNSLSWIIYLSDVLPGMATGVCAVSSAGALVSAAVFGAFVGIKSDGHDVSDKAFKITGTLAPVLIVLALLTNLVPSKETFYLIAGSEAGETVLTSPEAGKVRKVVNKWLDEQLTDGENNDQTP